MSLLSFFRDMKMRNKLILAFMTAILLPALIIGYFSASKSKSIILDQTSQISEIGFNQMKNNLAGKLSSYINVSTSILYDQTIINNLNANYSSNISYLDKYLYGFAPYQKLVKVFNPDNFLLSIYTTNETIIPDRSFINIVDSVVRAQQWYADTVKASGSYVVEKTYLRNQVGNTNNGLYFSICRLLSSPPTTKYTNVLKIEVPEEELFKLIEKEGSNKDIYLIDGSGNVITASKRQMVGSDYKSDPQLAKAVSEFIKTGSGRIQTPGGIAFCGYIEGSSTFKNWIFITMVSSSLLLKDINQIVQYIVYICTICVVIALAFIILFSRKLTSRLTALVNNMSHIRDGKFDVFVNFPEKDEFGELSRNFSSMIERINNLINEVYSARMRVQDIELQKKQAEINALQSQINPHFLFNTMESIRMSVLKTGDVETSDIIQRFSALLRKSIDWGKDLVTLSQEISLVENYLIIQKFRYRSKLSYEIHVDESLAKCQIPKFSIQPIVENAIYHGLERKEGRGLLVVSASLDNGRIQLTVQDDGVGMTRQRLCEVLEQLETGVMDVKNRVGIINVNQRLRLYYGTDYSISIQSAVTKGTTVMLWIPLNGDESRDTNV